MRSCKDITQEYSDLCAVLGNATVQYEMQKAQMTAKFKILNDEMQAAARAEEAAQLAVQSEKKAETDKQSKLSVLGKKGKK